MINDITLKSTTLRVLYLEFTPRLAEVFFTIAWYRLPRSAVDKF